MPRGKIAYLAASFRHIDACARGETPISYGTTAVPNPRFPALALFGRRPSECVERPSIPAAENLHMSRRLQCNNLTRSPPIRHIMIGGTVTAC
jgi:hypothetical protein